MIGGFAAHLGARCEAEDSEYVLEAAAVRLYESLSEQERQQACLEYDSPERDEMKFPGGARAGIQLRELEPGKQAACLELVKGFCSEYGARKCQDVAEQDRDGGLSKFYLAFFGVPGPGRTYAWRIAEHHLTIVHVEVQEGRPVRVGPILLGANPPGVGGGPPRPSPCQCGSAAPGRLRTTDPMWGEPASIHTLVAARGRAVG